jgi:putative endopeptidase
VEASNKPMRIRVIVALALFACTTTSSPRVAFDPPGFDTTVSSCDDFYGYVNTRWLAAHPIPADESIWGIASQPVRNVQLTLRDILGDG